MNIDWMFSFTVVIVGLCVVFAVLLLLVLSCFIMGKIFIKNNKDTNVQNIEPTNNMKSEVKEIKEEIVNQLNVIPLEDIAAISGAINHIMGDNNLFMIKTIKKIKESRNVWSTSAIVDNTRPF